MEKSYKQKTTLKWSMTVVLILCWILPVAIIAYFMQYVTTSKINNQIERTIMTSANNAIALCEMQMNNAVAASKRASALPEIRNSYIRFQKDGDKASLRNSVMSFLEQNYRYDKSMLYTTIFFPDIDKYKTQAYITYYGSTSNDAYRKNEEFKKNLQPLILQTYKDIGTDIEFISMDDSLYLVRNIMNSSYHPYGVIVMELDKEIVLGGLKSTWGYSGSTIYMDGKLLVSDRKDNKPLDPKMLKENNKECKILKEAGEYYAYAIRKPNIHYIGYVIELDERTIIDETAALKYIAILLISAMIPLLIIVFLFFNRKVSRPISELIKGSHVIEEGKYGYCIENPENSEEFEYLREAFNSMSETLKHQFETIYSEEMALKDARIMALQSQINPHFLNNTLEIINWEARINENYKVSKMIENLSIMLEATMDRRHRRFVTLAEEISYVEAYLYIIAQRLGERLHVEKNVDTALLNAKVPRLIIQPIIENAVEHGVIGQTHAIITLSVWREEARMIIEVHNTGSISKEDEEKIEMLLRDDYEPGEIGSASLGIRNVNRRLKIIYGAAGGLTIKNDQENGTISRIIVRFDE